jgi:hypothetical protein
MASVDMSQLIIPLATFQYFQTDQILFSLFSCFLFVYCVALPEQHILSDSRKMAIISHSALQRLQEKSANIVMMELFRTEDAG